MTSASNPLAIPVTLDTRHHPRFRHWRAALVLLPLLCVLALFSLAPTAWLLINSVQVDGAWSLANFSEILNSPFYRQAFGNSLWVSVCSSLIGLAIALVVAASLKRVDCALRDMTVAFTNMASNLSGVSLAFAFIIVMGTNGAVTLLLRRWGLLADFNLYTQTGLTLIYSYFQIPLAVLLLYPAFDALQDDWQEAASLLGASRASYWRLVALPVLLPAVLGTFILLLANAMGAYASAYALMTSNYNLVTIRISSLVAGDISLEPNLAAALSVLLVAMLVLVAMVNQLLMKRSYHAH
ncbi:ABC transporter permease [Pseudomonas fluorescens]|jgi:putative spermidine/putrescine transport system permease protein